MMLRKTAIILSLLLLVSACSGSKKELPPAKLVKFTPERTLVIEWSRSIGDGQGDLYNRLTPAVDGNALFVSSADGVVYALDRFNGKVKWKKKLKVPVSGGVSADYGVVLLGTQKGQVIALDSATGDVKWKANVNSEVLSSPQTNGTVVVVQTGADTLYGFDLYTGAQRWRYDNSPAILTLRGTSTPLVNSRLAVFALSTGHVMALDIERGVPIWDQAVAIPKGRSELERIVDIDGSLLLIGDTIYVVSYQGQVAALDLSSGGIKWQRSASSYTGVDQGFGNIYLSLANGTVQAIEENNSSSLWQNNQLARRQLSGPAVFSNYLAVGDYEGYIHLLSQADGHFVAREYVAKKGIRVRPLVVENIMYIYGNKGKLVALTLK